MADGERRMVFDTRGKRKHVLRVVYAILAILMGASLLLVVGPFNLGELAGGGGGGSASEVFEEQAERIEGRLAQNPQDEGLLLALTRAHINAGNAQIEPAAEGEVAAVPRSARKEFDAASEAWSRYLKRAGGEPSATVAQLVAATFFRLAEAGSTSYGEIEENLVLAVNAQRIAAKQQSNLGSLSTLAIYEYFNGDFAAGDKAKKEAIAEAPAKGEAEGIEKQLAQYRKSAKQFQKGAEQAAEQEQQVGQEALQNPFGLGGAPVGE